LEPVPPSLSSGEGLDGSAPMNLLPLPDFSMLPAGHDSNFMGTKSLRPRYVSYFFTPPMNLLTLIFLEHIFESDRSLYLECVKFALFWKIKTIRILFPLAYLAFSPRSPSAVNAGDVEGLFS